MHEIIKQHFTENIELLENDPKLFFLEVFSNSELLPSDAEKIAEIVQTVGHKDVDYEEARIAALNMGIEDVVVDWLNFDGGVSGLPLSDFVDFFMNNRIGFKKEFIINHMIQNSNQWSPYVKIYCPKTGSYMIERK